MGEKCHCPECGGELPADAPQGLCPKCLMKLGLQTGDGAAKPDAVDATSNGAGGTTPPGGFAPPEPAELAKQFPQLDILELLGQGGMGAVYKARQKHLDRVVALKILAMRPGGTEAFAERFVREARSLARLNHPSIVSIYDFGETDEGVFYLVMEFVDGTDLRHVIRAGELKAREALSIVPQICEALQYAHDEGIVHRDIKPENILLNKRGRVKIADYGLAKLLDMPAAVYTLTQSQQKMGTPHYMAPEQVEHPGQVDHRADIYSLGVVFYEMLTGELPLGCFAPPSQKVQVDVRLDNVVLRTLEKEPERRYQHASEVKTDVEVISSSSQAAVPSRPTAGDETEGARRRVRAPGIGLMIAGLINCGVGFLTLLAGMTVGVLAGAESLGATIPGGIGVGFAAVGLLTVVGALRMMRLQSYGWAVAANILQLTPTPGSMLGFAFGIWGLIVLTRPQVHEAFVTVAVETGGTVKDGAGRVVLVIIAVVASLIFLVALAGSLHRGRFPWFVFLFGPPVLILDVFAVARRRRRASPVAGSAASAGGQPAAAGEAEPKRRRGTRVLAIVAIVASFALAGVVTMEALHMFWPSTGTREMAPYGIPGTGIDAESRRQTGLPADSLDNVAFGPEARTLIDSGIERLGLAESQAEAVRGILNAANKDYLALERRHTQTQRMADSLKVTISPFREEAEAFLEQVWAELEEVVDEQQQVIARERLPLRQVFGTYGFGGPTVEIAISKAGGEFYYSTIYKWPKQSDKSDRGGEVSSGTGKTLPDEYRRFWDEIAADK